LVSSLTSRIIPYVRHSPSSTNPEGKPHKPSNNPFFSYTNKIYYLSFIIAAPVPTKYPFASFKLSFY
jgi:hypothetical protein